MPMLYHAPILPERQSSYGFTNLCVIAEPVNRQAR